MVERTRRHCPLAPSGADISSPQSYNRQSSYDAATPSVVGSVTQYSVTPALPTGSMIDGTSGQITGTPTSRNVHHRRMS